MSFHGVIVGRLGADPETRIAGQSTVTTLRVATDAGWGGRKTTTWTTMEIWGRRGEAAAEHLRRGRAVECSGEVSLEEWEGRDGKRWTLRLLHADWTFVPTDVRSDGAGRVERDQEPRRAHQQQERADDDIPF